MPINKKIQQLEFNVKKNISWDFFGLYKSAFKWQWIDFSEIREYEAGDPIKNIDWNSSAKHGKLYTKLYEQERDIKVLFLLDIWETMQFGTENKTKLEIMEEIFMSLAMCVNNSNDSIGTMLYDKEILAFYNFKKWQENLIKTIKKIEEYKSNEQSDIFSAINYTYKLNIQNTLIFVLTDNMEFEQRKFQSIATNNDIIYINIFDYYENNLSHNISIAIGENNKWINWLYPNNKKILKYKQLRKDKIWILQKNLRKIDIDYLEINNRSDIFKELSNLFYIRSQY